MQKNAEKFMSSKEQKTPEGKPGRNYHGTA
jgi:hypothetical protein